MNRKLSFVYSYRKFSLLQMTIALICLLLEADYLHTNEKGKRKKFYFILYHGFPIFILQVKNYSKIHLLNFGVQNRFFSSVESLFTYPLRRGWGLSLISINLSVCICFLMSNYSKSLY